MTKYEKDKIKFKCDNLRYKLQILDISINKNNKINNINDIIESKNKWLEYIKDDMTHELVGVLNQIDSIEVEE